MNAFLRRTRGHVWAYGSPRHADPLEYAVSSSRTLSGHSTHPRTSPAPCSQLHAQLSWCVVRCGGALCVVRCAWCAGLVRWACALESRSVQLGGGCACLSALAAAARRLASCSSSLSRCCASTLSCNRATLDARCSAATLAASSAALSRSASAECSSAALATCCSNAEADDGCCSRSSICRRRARPARRLLPG